MKKIYFILLSCLVLTLNASAQSKDQQSVKQLNAGFGLSGWGIPIYVGMDFGVHPDITIGGELSYRRYSEKYFGYSYNSSVFGLLFNGNYHFNRLLELPKQWDVYAGANAGFYFWSHDYDDNIGYKGESNGFGIGIQIGGRYYFSDNLGINLELGGGNSVSGAKLGISYLF